MTRRELLTALAAVPLLTRAARSAVPAGRVSIAKVPSYDADLVEIMSTMFDQAGGLDRLVRNKTVTIKLNLTGGTDSRLGGKLPAITHYTHPKTVLAMCHLLDAAGAKRIRLVEGAYASSAPLEEFMLNAGWNVRAFRAVAKNIEFENTNVMGQGKAYHRITVPGQGLVFPAYQVNHSYVDTDVFVSMAKLKNHATCGVTLTTKNLFGITPISIYGDDAGVDEPNEQPTSGRGAVGHQATRQPAKCAPAELDPASPRDATWRMPRIAAELSAARPIDIAFIDGIQTLAGGEGPWVEGVQAVQPGVLILGTNSVATDTVATAVMGYDPRARRGTPPFTTCDNTLLLAEALGVGTADLDKIDVAGASIAQARFPFANYIKAAPPAKGEKQQG
jgi:uncharacterized protein (DUF362 family)